MISDFDIQRAQDELRKLEEQVRHDKTEILALDPKVAEARRKLNALRDDQAREKRLKLEKDRREVFRKEREKQDEQRRQSFRRAAWL